ncbi:hypothetical protein BGZ76_008485 [Entomortierella beljakovae]|nr:hypothetical protein BGZ76_008485 [Entomortierella beljakovae]
MCQILFVPKLALLTQAAAKRSASDPITVLDPNIIIKKPRIQTSAELQDLDIILAINRYGGLINIEDYKALEPSFFLQNYKSFKHEIAQKLAGAVIDTGSQAVLVHKVEVYGRAPNEDPHLFNLVKPTLHKN